MTFRFPPRRPALYRPRQESEVLAELSEELLTEGVEEGDWKDALGATLAREARQLHDRYPAPNGLPIAGTPPHRGKQTIRVAVAVLLLALAGVWLLDSDPTSRSLLRSDDPSKGAPQERGEQTPVLMAEAGQPSDAGVPYEQAMSVPGNRETTDPATSGSPTPALYLSSPELEAMLDLVEDRSSFPNRIGF